MFTELEREHHTCNNPTDCPWIIRANIHLRSNLDML